MAYISKDGSLLQAEPWGRRSMKFVLEILHMFSMFFRSFVDPVVNMFGATSEDSQGYSSSARDYRPGSRLPRRPFHSIGRLNTGSSDIYTPGPAGGCGCG